MEELKSLATCSPTAQPANPDPRAKKTSKTIRSTNYLLSMLVLKAIGAVELKGSEIQLGFNVCYIVCGVVIVDGKVLMIQEAKPSCRGQWYLPAGRMEKNESIVDAVKREVLEEAGLNFEPEALVAVECQSTYWIRFVFTGQITGGTLKTPAQADKESIQAGWFPADSQQLQGIGLRADDCLGLVEVARDWYQQRSFTGLPVQVGHVSSSLRLVVIHTEGTALHVLMLTEPKGTTSFPVCVLGSESSINTSARKTLKAYGYTKGFKTKGVLSVEHLGSPHGVYDGLCLSLVLLASSRELDGAGNLSRWVRVEEETSLQRLRTAVTSDFGCARINDILRL